MQMVKAIIVLALSTSILSATAAETNTNMRAGLWEVTTSSDLLLLAKLIPKEQLKGIEKIAKEYGLQMPEIENGAAISTTCITQDMAEKQTLPQLYQEELNCKTSSTTRQGNQYQTRFSCNSDQLKGQGTAKANITNAISFTGTSHFKGFAQGAPVDEKATFKGKWISKVCQS